MQQFYAQWGVSQAAIAWRNYSRGSADDSVPEALSDRLTRSLISSIALLAVH